MRPDDGNTGCAEIKLFGVKIGVSSDGVDGGDGGAAIIRRTKSTGNIVECIPEKVVVVAAAAEDESRYLSDGNHDSKSRERKRGTPWTEEEHRSFLEGLLKLGKGDWKGISSKFVPSRKSSQVASHAQKYFNRVNTSQAIKKRRRTSVFDITSINDTASSSSAATNVNTSEPNIPLPTHVPNPNSERPPLAPMKQSTQDARDVIYQTRVPSIAKAYNQPQSLIPSISWVPVVSYPNQQNGVFVPSIHGGFLPHQPWRPAWIRPASKSTTNNDELNIHIRNLTL